MPPHGMAVTGTDCTQMPGIGHTFSGYLSMITSSIRVACRNSQFRGTHKFLRVHHVFEETLLLTTWPDTDALHTSVATTRIHTPECWHVGWSQSPNFCFSPFSTHPLHTVWTWFFAVWFEIKCENHEDVVQNMQSSHQLPLFTHCWYDGHR